LGWGKLMDFSLYVFIMVRCCTTTVRIHLRPQGTGWGVLAPCTDSTSDPRQDPYRLAVGIRDQIQSTATVVLGMQGAHYEHDTLSLINFQITNLALLLCGCM